jgi:hypothetical protein
LKRSISTDIAKRIIKKRCGGIRRSGTSSGYSRKVGKTTVISGIVNSKFEL